MLFATLAAISLIGMQELYKAMRVHENQAGSLEIMGYAGAMVYYLTLLLDREEFSLIAILFALVLIMSVYVLHTQNTMQTRSWLPCSVLFTWLSCFLISIKPGIWKAVHGLWALSL